MYAFYTVLSLSFILLPPQGLKCPEAIPAAELQGALENPGGSEASAAQRCFTVGVAVGGSTPPVYLLNE